MQTSENYGLMLIEISFFNENSTIVVVAKDADEGIMLLNCRLQ